MKEILPACQCRLTEFDKILNGSSSENLSEEINYVGNRRAGDNFVYPVK